MPVVPDVGMFLVQSDTNNLQSDISLIYQGTTGSSYKACNRIQSYQKPWLGTISDANGYGEHWQFLLQKTNAVVCPGTVKCLIGDLSQTKIYGTAGWYLGPNNQVNVTHIQNLVYFICTQTTVNERMAILGWYVLDEPMPGKQPDLQAFHTMVN